MHSLKGDRAVAVRVNGTVKELGTVATPGFDVGTACLAAASLLTGQYFLARIDQKLNAILKGVDHIFEFLDSTELAELNSAIMYLRASRHTVWTSGFSERIALDARDHRAKCMTIATRNLEVLEQKPVKRESRIPLGPTESLRVRWRQASGWVGSQVSRAIPSRREGKLMAETREFANTICRGLVALQAVLCFEALLDDGPSSPYAFQACSMVQRYGIARAKFLEQFAHEKNAALDDWRYFNAEKKSARFQQELAGLVEPVDLYWKMLTEMVDLWQARVRDVPEVLFVSVGEAGRPLEVFLPMADLGSGA